MAVKIDLKDFSRKLISAAENAEADEEFIRVLSLVNIVRASSNIPGFELEVEQEEIDFIENLAKAKK